MGFALIHNIFTAYRLRSQNDINLSKLHWCFAINEYILIVFPFYFPLTWQRLKRDSYTDVILINRYHSSIFFFYKITSLWVSTRVINFSVICSRIIFVLFLFPYFDIVKAFFENLKVVWLHCTIITFCQFCGLAWLHCSKVCLCPISFHFYTLL